MRTEEFYGGGIEHENSELGSNICTFFFSLSNMMEQMDVVGNYEILNEGIGIHIGCWFEANKYQGKRWKLGFNGMKIVVGIGKKIRKNGLFEDTKLNIYFWVNFHKYNQTFKYLQLI